MPERAPGLDLAATILALCQNSGASLDTQHEALTVARLVVANAVDAARPKSLSAMTGA